MTALFFDREPIATRLRFSYNDSTSYDAEKEEEYTMSTYTDGKKAVKIAMRTWTGTEYTPSFEADFFGNGSLPCEDGKYIVPDVDYLVEQALAWKAGTGDYVDEFEGEAGHTPDTRIVDVKTI